MMKELVTLTKVQNLLDNYLIKKLPQLEQQLLSGNLLEFERTLKNSTDQLYNGISDLLLKSCSKALIKKLKQEGKASNLKRLRERKLSVQIGTGYVIKVDSVYAHDVPEDYKQSRHLLANYWKILSNSSLNHIDKVCMGSVLSPSYMIANQLLTKMGVKQGVSRVRKLTNDIAFYCKEIEAELSLKSKENLIGKRVIIGIDGGRTRTRIYRGDVNKKGNKTYDTKWREPKLFVIHTLDENGQLDRNQKPIYGCRFEEEAILELLKSYLKRLKIEGCHQVQILADGAPWIWNNIQPILIQLGVKERKIVETLDYYHAIGYVNSLVEGLPKKYRTKKREELSKQFTEWLWTGKSDKIVSKCNELYRKPDQLTRRWINYLDKHQSKTQYADYQNNKLMCGSGIIESGIRRIVNLRFKSPGIFWYEENVENLFFFVPLFFLTDGIFL